MDCYAERCFLSGASTLAAEANQRVRIHHAGPHLLSVHARQPDNSYICFTEESASFVCCILHVKRLVLARLRVL
jgi:hypothetical protein